MHKEKKNLNKKKKIIKTHIQTNTKFSCAKGIK